jgi:transposase
MGRGDLSNAEWERLRPLLPPETGRRGGRWRDHRQVINGIIWRIRTGAPERDLPERYGSWQTCYKRFARWETDGTWARIQRAVQRDAERSRRPQGGLTPQASATQQGLGRSRGGLSTKIHVVGDGRGRPLVTRATPGQAADTTALMGLVDAVRVARPGGVGRPRVRPDYLVADKAYSSRANRAGLRARVSPHTIPEHDDQRVHRRCRGRLGGRPVRFCREQCRRRNQVERGFNRRKQLRAVATRYDTQAPL